MFRGKTPRHRARAQHPATTPGAHYSARARRRTDRLRRTWCPMRTPSALPTHPKDPLLAWLSLGSEHELTKKSEKRSCRQLSLSCGRSQCQPRAECRWREKERERERRGGGGGGGYALRRSLEGAQGSCRAAVLGAPLPAAAALVPVPPSGASIACNGRVISPSWGVLCLAPAPARLRAPLAPPPLYPKP